MSTADTSSNKPTESWLDWFVGRESREVINKSNKEKNFETFDATVSKIDCIKEWFSTKKQLIYKEQVLE